MKLKNGNLHWLHWCVILASLILTLLAWYVSKTAYEKQYAAAFDRAATQVVELIQERMRKYEDALWAGVAATYKNRGVINNNSWRLFTETLRIEEKYPGVNGIGVIFYVSPDSLDVFLQNERNARPDFQIHPPHQHEAFWPITYIEPVDINANAVGLDIAHEKNRYTAATLARDTGKAQITGPIVLVQDADRTPGFLFYAPFYKTPGIATTAERKESFVGLIYAPFVVKKLMDGTLRKETRSIGVKISDQDQVLYDENNVNEADYDPNPMFSRAVTLDIYGRSWRFDLRSTLDFRLETQSYQPLIILLGGIIVEIILIILFLSLIRAHRSKALALQELETKYQLYMDASGNGYWDWDIPQDYQFMSPNFWRMFGYQPEEKPHKVSAWQSIIFEDDLQLMTRALAEHINTRGKTPFALELRVHHKDGSMVYVLCRGRVVQWSLDDKPLRMVGTNTDITVLKTIESDLREVKEQYDLAVQGSGVGLWDWNIQKDCVYWSDRFKEIIGITDESFNLSFDGFSHLLHPEDKSEVLGVVKAHLGGGRDCKVECRLRHNKGHYIWVLIRAQALWDEEGKATRMSGSIADVTRDKETGMALKGALEFQKLLVSVNTDLIFVKDKEFRIVEANPAFINLYPEEQRSKIIGSTTIEAYDAQQAEEFLIADKQAFKEGKSEVVESIDFPDGIRRTLLTKKIRFEDVNQQEFILGVARDISEIKKTEDELISANSELEEFAYRTSHDLRSPLISSVKLLDIIRDQIKKDNSEKSIEYVNLVQDSLKKLETLVADILSLTKVNHLDSPVALVSIRDEVERSLKKITHLDEGRRVNFLFDYSYDGSVSVQKEQLTLVLDNLLSNAVKYQDKNEDRPTVEISTRRVKNFLVLIIADNGLGIPERYQSNIFQMFKRFHPNTAFGSGLGLYMVRKSVEKMGGVIEYRGLTKGSEFIVKLPLNS